MDIAYRPQLQSRFCHPELRYTDRRVVLYLVEVLDNAHQDPRLAPSVSHLNKAASENPGSRSGSLDVRHEGLHWSPLTRTFVFLHRHLRAPLVLDNCEMMSSSHDGLPAEVSSIRVRLGIAESVSATRSIS
jgi:hypothetical protein